MKEFNDSLEYKTPEFNRLYDQLVKVLFQIGHVNENKPKNEIEEIPPLKLKFMIEDYEELIAANS